MRGRRNKKTRSETKNNFKIKTLFVLQIIFVIAIIISLKNIITWKMNNDENKEILKEISDAIEVETETKTNTEAETENIETATPQYNIDFMALKEKNSDTVAWIKVNGTNIEYPVVKSTDNSFYLNHNFNKKYSAAGWIFTDYRNKIDGTDKNIVVYGHNRKDGSMFGSAKNFIEKEWYENEENRKLTFITEMQNATYEVFSIYQIEKETYYTTTEFNNNEFESFIQTIKSRSIADFEVDVTSEDNILTVSTCATNNQYRIVLHAKKIAQ